MVLFFVFSDIFYTLSVDKVYATNNNEITTPREFFNWFFKNEVPNVINSTKKTTDRKVDINVICDKFNVLLADRCIEIQKLKDGKRKNLLGDPIFDDNGNLIIFNNNEENSSDSDYRPSYYGKNKKDVLSKGTILYKTLPNGEHLIGFKNKSTVKPDRKHKKKQWNISKGYDTLILKYKKNLANNPKKRYIVDNVSFSGSSESADFESSDYENIKEYDKPLCKTKKHHNHQKKFFVRGYYRKKPQKLNNDYQHYHRYQYRTPIIKTTELGDVRDSFIINNDEGIDKSVVNIPVYDKSSENFSSVSSYDL